MKKKFKIRFAVLAASGMILMTGCGNSNSQMATVSSQETVQTSGAAETTAAAETSEAADTDETTVPEDALVITKQ